MGTGKRVGYRIIGKMVFMKAVLLVFSGLFIIDTRVLDIIVNLVLLQVVIVLLTTKSCIGHNRPRHPSLGTFNQPVHMSRKCLAFPPGLFNGIINDVLILGTLDNIVAG